MASFFVRLLGGALIAAAWGAARADGPPHSVIIFVADGLRALSVRPDVAPAMSSVRDQGVWFKNSHALFPTFTTPNAAAMATGHHIGDHGDFGNTLYAGFPVATAGRSVTPFLENDAVLGEMNEHLKGDYLSERSLFAAARAPLWSAATRRWPTSSRSTPHWGSANSFCPAIPTWRRRTGSARGLCRNSGSEARSRRRISGKLRCA